MITAAQETDFLFFFFFINLLRSLEYSRILFTLERVNGEMDAVNTGCSYKFVRRGEIILFRIVPNWTLQLIDAQI